MAKPLYCGAANVMQAFDSLRPDNAYFSVWQGNKMLYQYNGEDMNAGRDILDQMMTAAENNYNTDVFDIKFHSKLDDGYITNKSKIIGTMPVRAYDTSDSSTEGITGLTRPGDIPKPVYNMLQKIEEHMTMDARLKALEEAKPDVKEPDWFDRISGLLEKPGMVETVGSLLAPLLQKLIPGAPVQNVTVNGVRDKVDRRIVDPAANVAAVEAKQVEEKPIGHVEETDEFTDAENAIIDKAILDLSVYCNPVEVLPKLVEFATTDPATFEFLLKQLK